MTSFTVPWIPTLDGKRVADHQAFLELDDFLPDEKNDGDWAVRNIQSIVLTYPPAIEEALYETILAIWKLTVVAPVFGDKKDRVWEDLAVAWMVRVVD